MKRIAFAGFAASALLAGCSLPTVGGDIPAGGGVARTPEFKIEADAGVPVTQSADANRFKALVAARADRWGSSRPDPFGLTGGERTLDELATSDRFLNEQGGFTLAYTPPPDAADTPPIVEQQPYRRLSGIIVSESIVAIIEMGDGTTQIIRPGQRIPNSPWRVVSINESNATLVRSGNVEPRIIQVRLESPPANLAQPGAGAPGPGGPGMGAPGGMGGPGMGMPGMGPGGGGGLND